MLLQSKRLFVYMVYLSCFTNIFKCQKYEKLQGYLFSTGTMLWSDDDPLSVIQCIAVCKMTMNCYAISITYPAGICAYYDWYLGSSAAVSMTFGSENDYIVFVKPISVLYMADGYSFTFVAAGDFCASIGGRLTTYAELEVVWMDGYDLCGCGWVSNGNAYYPTNVPRHGCSWSVTITRCSWLNTWGIYCNIE